MQLPFRPSSVGAHERRFVSAGNRRPKRESRNSTAEHWIIAGWALILLKCVVIWWLIERYHVPIHPLWLVGPTLLFGALATATYIWRE